ncbi:PREDICTED: uncharacterized protein LOC109240630 [Nicotiana attenuata]|uniref:uncharacterized protein LOC109240630 n=1 Tax=Nicotiana attenuata TaxID=49451 RepID=UPI00090514FA|nr:PREDICTED: uncharacterized protein LOC109240630 [Nicotiana attenuata]
MTSYNSQHGNDDPHISKGARRKIQQEIRKNPTWAEREIPQHVVHIIIGGTDIPQRLVIKRIKISAVIEGPIRDRVTEDTLAFSEEDFGTLTQPHNDALVISFLLNNIRIKRVLVDPGSSANVIRSKVVEQLGLLGEIVPASRVLHDFNMAGEIMKEEITLSVDISGTV